MAVRVGLITTLGTNIGDDFIREGVKRVVAAVLGGREVEFVPVNKHEPLTVYPEWHPVRLAESLPRGRGVAQRVARRTMHRLPLTRFDGCDVIVQCGAPVLWPGCRNAEWAEPLWNEVVGRLAGRIPVLNLAAGSCYPWERRDEAEVEAEDVAYVRRMLEYCRLTTAREPLAQRLYASVGGDVPFIRCSALLAAKDHPTPTEKGLVLVNYMKGAGHYDWGQGSSADAWEATLRTVLGRLKERYRVEFICHNRAEYDLAAELDPTLRRHLPTTPAEYFEVTSRATAALCNRLHASVAMAGMGIPSVAVGTDTRMLMVEAVGVPCYFVKDADADVLEARLEDLVARRAEESERLLAGQAETWNAYLGAVSAVLD